MKVVEDESKYIGDLIDDINKQLNDVRERKKAAKSQGDLSENYDYITANEEERWLLNRVDNLHTRKIELEKLDETLLNGVTYLDDSIQLFCTVNFTISFKNGVTENKECLIATLTTDNLSIVDVDTPLINSMLGRHEGDKFMFNRNTITINKVIFN